MLKSVMLGNEALLNCEKIGFLASRRVPPEAVMRCLDWATRMRDEGVCVMSGFQSPLEKEVLNILLKGSSPLILVLSPVSQSIRMETPLPSAWRRLFHPHRMTHPFRVVPGIYGVTLFAFSPCRSPWPSSLIC